MELTLSQLQQFTAGTASIEQINGVIRFRRFTHRQIHAFGAMSEDFYPRARATTGCRIDFHTDSGTLTVETAGMGKYEVMVDALPRFRFDTEKPEKLTMDLGPGEKRVTIVLPSHCEGMLSAVHVADGASLRPHEYKRRLLFIGDSITQGWDSHWDCLSFAWQATTCLDADSMILGVGGSFFCSATLEDVGFSPDAVIIAYGTNDLFHFGSLAAFHQACREYLDTVKVQYPGTKVFCITPLWRADAGDASIGTLDDIRSVIAAEASGHGFTVINGSEMVPHVPEFYADQYLHPNDLGFSIYAKNLVHALDQHM